MTEPCTPGGQGVGTGGGVAHGPFLPSPISRRAAVLDLGLIVAVLYAVTVLPKSWLATGLDSTASTYMIVAVTRGIALDCTVMVTLAFALLRYRRLPVESIGISTRAIETQILLALSAVVCASALDFGLLVVEGLFRSRGENMGDSAGGFVNDLIAAPRSSMLVLLMLSAVVEEVTYRGLLLRYLTWLLRDPPIAVLISALVFGLAHNRQGDLQMLSAMWTGLVLGTFYVRRGSLITVAVAHFVYNVTLVEVLRLYSG